MNAVGSYYVSDYYLNPDRMWGPAAQWDERMAPVPGWGMNPRWAGPRRVGIGGYPLGMFGQETAPTAPAAEPGVLDKAKAWWGAQSTTTKIAIAGGGTLLLVCMLRR